MKEYKNLCSLAGDPETNRRNLIASALAYKYKAGEISRNDVNREILQQGEWLRDLVNKYLGYGGEK